MPTVSAVIPAYNSATVLFDAIRSAIAQTYPLEEIIVVDDGSTDKTAEVAASFPGVTVIRQTNGGQGAARNTGIRAARGEWIALLDADDIWHPAKTATQIEHVKGPSVGVVHANKYEHIDFDTLWLLQNHVTPSGALVRRSAIVAVGGFDEDRAILGVEDLNLWERMAFAGWKFVRAGSGLFEWREAPSGHFSGNDRRMAAAGLRNVEKIAALASRPASEVNRLKESIRLQCARYMIAKGDPKHARDLLRSCAGTFPVWWLRLAAMPFCRRLAREDIMSLLT